MDIAPCLYQAVQPRAAKVTTVDQALHDRAWVKQITGAITVQVLLDFLLIWDKVRRIVLQADIDDTPLWKWTANQQFTTASAYRAFFLGQHEILGARILQKTRAPPKCKFFVWLALHDKCWTAARRRRHNLQNDDACALCGQESETISHILLTCVFSRVIWFNILQSVGLQLLSPTPNQLAEFQEWWSSSRKRIQTADRKSFDTLVVLVAWSLWLERNARTFGRQSRNTAQLIQDINQEGNNWSQAHFMPSLLLGRQLGVM
ncbi:hypothetical protein HU200_036816 [Digitaria exilis]|uniref:Reverse transcriptase zinc-binding domain-containing protein n=1 Tax=Digitaria exilis TaxID=1010633 RepID=A0A835BKI3_9POAL|nr:hypothetical protein HU200_036816 [Digitaria exilis]